MTITTQKLSYGHYAVLRDGVQVALVNKVVDSSEPVWEMIVLDGTDTSRRNGKHHGDFVTLKDAVRLYTYCAQKAAA